MGPLPVAPGGLQHLAIAIERAKKWVEAKPIPTINGRQIQKFALEYIICRFGIPKTVTSKEEKHFTEGIFADFCKGLKIVQTFNPTTEHAKIANLGSSPHGRPKNGEVLGHSSRVWNWD